MSTIVGSAPYRSTAPPAVPSGSNLGLSGVRIRGINRDALVIIGKMTASVCGAAASSLRINSSEGLLMIEWK